MSSSAEKIGTCLVLGGARSGKSVFAESLCKLFDKKIYLATAEILDSEMAERVRRHQERRGGSWPRRRTAGA